MEAKYYIIDLIPDDESKAYEVIPVEETEFYDHMDENYDCAKDCGDVVPKKRTMLRDFENEPDHEEAFNGFSYLKLSTMTPEQWGY